jgi:hypothetical protein
LYYVGNTGNGSFHAFAGNPLNRQLLPNICALLYGENDCTRIAGKKFVGNVAIPATCRFLLEDPRGNDYFWWL